MAWWITESESESESKSDSQICLISSTKHVLNNYSNFVFLFVWLLCWDLERNLKFDSTTLTRTESCFVFVSYHIKHRANCMCLRRVWSKLELTVGISVYVPLNCKLALKLAQEENVMIIWWSGPEPFIFSMLKLRVELLECFKR